MEPKSLFDKPMSELRKAFVRACFAERTIFGQEDIEAWLEDPTQETISFARAPYFLRCFERRYGGDLERILRDNATPSPEPPAWLTDRIEKFGRVPAEFATIVRVLQNGGARVYYPWENVIDLPPVAIIGSCAWVLRPCANHVKPVLSVDKAGTRDVFEILNGEILHRRPKAGAARAFLKQEARHAILQARKMVEKDFDEAVAISDDGKTITKAAWVLVLSNEPGWQRRGILFANERFQSRKCRLGDAEPRESFLDDRAYRDYKSGAPNPEVEACRSFVCTKQPHPGLTLYVRNHQKGDDFLLVDLSDCPSPLPDGGREITI